MEKFTVRLILEILGRPAENVTQALQLLIDKLSKEQNVQVLGKKIHEPRPVEKSNDLFTSFAEVEIEFTHMQTLFHILFTYMPSNVEVIKPEHVVLTNQDFNQSANYLMARLHQYDSIAKKLLGERDFLSKKLYEVAPHLFKQNPVKQPAVQEQEKKEDNKTSKSSKKKRL